MCFPCSFLVGEAARPLDLVFILFTSCRRRVARWGAVAVVLLTLCLASRSQAATYVVDSTADTNLTACTAAAGDCTLRGAFNNANSNLGADIINFAIPGTGAKTITVSSVLPTLTGNGAGTTIDGYSQSGASLNTQANSSNAVLLIQMRPFTNGDVNGLVIGAANCTVRGLQMDNFGNSITISGSGATGNKIVGNFFGTNTNSPVNNYAVDINGASNNTVGGTTAGERNVICNSGTGVRITGSGATGNKVSGNFIGVGADGTNKLANSSGVYISEGAAGNTVGGTSAGERNIISGNSSYSIYIVNSGTGNKISGNFIGTTADGTAKVGNGPGNTLYIELSINTLIGGTTAGERNVISNTNDGIAIHASGTKVIGNYIGTDATGTVALGNYDGIRIEGVTGVVIGGATAGERNVISGNTRGIYMQSSNTTGNKITGNYIGTNADGTAALANGTGVSLYDTSGNTIGGTTAGERNLISGNTTSGILLDGGTTGIKVSGNYIGTSADGSARLGNRYGISINGSPSNTIGGTTASERNTISGSGETGILISGSKSTGNKVSGNYIGTTADGTAQLGNSNGISIDGSPSNTIGGTTAGERNLISGNSQFSVLISGSGATGNKVSGNYIGTTADGTAKLGNFLGILIFSASSNTVGGTTAGERNVISGNTNDGISIFGINPTGNKVSGNYIGTNAAGTAILGNANGVSVSDAPNTTIGGTTMGERNLISGNTNGVVVGGTDTTGFKLVGNYIGTNADGTAALINSSSGVSVSDTANVTIGGTTASERNIISGNRFGIFISVDPNTTTTGTKVTGNYIGTNAAGTNALANSTGVYIYGATGTIIGGTTAGERNVISGNTNNGVTIITSSTTGTKVSGNYIGTSADGTAKLTNATGISITGAPSTTIGGTTAGERNVIGGSTVADVQISGSDATGNKVSGNYIGTNAAGIQLLTVSVPGVSIEGAPNNTIGGTTAGERNVITSNYSGGIKISGSGATGNKVTGNYIGFTPNGTTFFNFTIGIGIIVNNAPSNTIGGTTAGERNVVSGTQTGVQITGAGATGNKISGNYIGTNIAGTDRFPTGNNGNDTGISIEDAPGNIVGGTTAGERNLISGNSAGVIITGVGATGNKITGNYIGLNSAGDANLYNSTGVRISNAPDTTIGGTTAGERNVIGGNSSGVNIFGDSATGNKVIGNYIGTNAAGTAQIGNGYGVYLSSANNIIGGTTAGERNVISGNGNGVIINGTTATGNKVAGNSIGTNAAGTAVIANTTGVYISTASGNTVGGTDSGAGNIISGSTKAGVAIISGTGDKSTGNSVRGNSIACNGTLGIDLGNDGVTANDAGDGDTGANSLQNFPVLSSVSTSGGNTTISGTLNSTASTQFTLDFYSNDAANASGYGEGQTYLGSTTATTDASGNASFSVTLSGVSAASGAAISATATDPNGNTSEFCKDILLADPTGSSALVVTTTQDVESNDGLVSLREAINTANSNSGADTITFALPGSGAQTIQLASTLPSLDDNGTIIDGYSQSGASQNTLFAANNAVVKVQVRGTGNFNGLLITGANCTVRGLSLTNLINGVIIIGAQATGNKITGNYLGLAPNGSAAANATGIYVVTTKGNTIGGATTGERNVISGNTNYGVHIGGSATTGNKVVGNFIGTNLDATLAIGNGIGVYLNGAPGNMVGGMGSGADGFSFSVGERNVISGNTSSGVSINGSAASGNKVMGNFIGTSASGSAKIPNGTGVSISDAPGNFIGGTNVGGGNTISGSTNNGVTITGNGATGNRVRGNSITGNGKLGIDLGDDGVNGNDVGDTDEGPNGLQNIPTLLDAQSRGNTVTVAGTLPSTGNTAFALDLYASPSANSSGYGEGQIYLGSTTITTEVGGNSSFTAVLPATTFASGAFISATVTDPNGNTSEFSQSLKGTVITEAASLRISEFRLSGPNGARDEYIELTNQTASPVDLSSYTLAADAVQSPLSGLTLAGKSIPAFGHFLITNGGGYSLGAIYPSTYPVGSTTPSSYATGDVTYTGDIALASTLTLSNGATVIDRVSNLSNTSGLVSGNQYAFVRRQDGPILVNTGTSSSDFVLVDTASTNGPPSINGASVTPSGARLGTPGPQNAAGPVRRATLTLVPLDPATNQGIVPEGRYASRGSSLDPFGRLTLRRTLTNYGSTTLKQIRFTLVRTPAGSSSDASVADLRAITSVGVSANGSKVVQGIQIEAPTTPTTPSNQLSSGDTGNGGGMNASWNVGTLPAGGLAPGQSMNVEFVFGIVRLGNYNTSIVIDVSG